MTAADRFVNQIINFTDYCDEFYTIETGMYRIAKREDILDAVLKFVTQTNLDVAFDSFDREAVRVVLETGEVPTRENPRIF